MILWYIGAHALPLSPFVHNLPKRQNPVIQDVPRSVTDSVRVVT